jgi:hypothetical protein
MQKSQSNLSIMQSFRCTPRLAHQVKAAARILHINESVLLRMAVTAGLQQIVAKHLNQTDA